MRRVISLIDMDCFYAQVEQRDNPALWDQPVIVVQHSRQGVEGGILAVSYEARPFGVKRGMSVADAKLKCPQINVCHVPIGEYADKADIQKYRDASAEVFRVLNNFDTSIIVEKASVDEAFLDLTTYTNERLEELRENGNLEEFTAIEHLPTTFLATGEDVKENDHLREQMLTDFITGSLHSTENILLLIAACTVEAIRDRIHEETQFYCSAGVGNNKMMAKLVCARHKPRQQTLIPWVYVREILRTTPIGDVRGFGGKLGNRVQELLNITLMGEILEIDYSLLVESFPDQHEYLIAIAQGMCDEPVRPRKESSSIAVSKNFPGKLAIRTIQELRKWLDGLTKELAKRLWTDQNENKRTAENLVYSLLTEEGKPQKTLKINNYHPDVLFGQIWAAIKVLNRSNLANSEQGPWTPPILNISLSASRFQPGIPAATRSIKEFLGEKKRRKWVRQHAVYDENDGRADVIIEEPPPPKTPAASKPSTSTIGSVEYIVIDDSDEETAPPPPPKSTTNIDYITVDGKKISKKVFRNLPPEIKKQYEHRIALEEARLLKAKSDAKNSRKRAGPIKSDVQKTKKPKPLDSFFKKKT
ncbi:CBN-POLH-1 protein [Caenorhabditis brenneri]|uniref:DNA polymerase eta n=1 Tax=Caenorhabditis brenneri TaxID=135651 RepID=G0NBR7_CAEBE|nr:CBN-POLH-1 protein [Caenorhabditis brenneri]